jgi:hypothetical protein
MMGHPADEDRRNLRLAQITQYIEQLYTDRFNERISEDGSRLDTVARYAIAALEYKAAHLPLTTMFQEAWTELRHVASEDERQSLIAKPTPEAVTRFLKSPDTERYVRNTAYAFFKPTDYPTHDLLLHLLWTAPFPEHDPKEVDQMASLLDPWKEQRLVSGHSVTCRFGTAITPALCTSRSSFASSPTLAVNARSDRRLARSNISVKGRSDPGAGSAARAGRGGFAEAVGGIGEANQSAVVSLRGLIKGTPMSLEAMQWATKGLFQ